jgi:hypothetical protein
MFNEQYTRKTKYFAGKATNEKKTIRGEKKRDGG